MIDGIHSHAYAAFNATLRRQHLLATIESLRCKKLSSVTYSATRVLAVLCLPRSLWRLDMVSSYHGASADYADRYLRCGFWQLVWLMSSASESRGQAS